MTYIFITMKKTQICPTIDQYYEGVIIYSIYKKTFLMSNSNDCVVFFFTIS